MPMRATFLIFGLSVLASGWAIKPVAAATSSALFSVSATVQASCVAAITAPAIKTYAAAADAASAVLVTCANSAPYNVSLNAENVHDATEANRPTTGSGFASPGYTLSSGAQAIANRGHATSTGRVAGFGGRSNPSLSLHDEFPAAKCVSSGAHAGVMIVVVTY